MLVLLCVALAEVTGVNSQVPFIARAQDLEDLWEAARSTFSTSRPSAQRVRDLASSFLEASASVQWKPPQIGGRPSWERAEQKDAFEQRVAARMDLADPLKEFKVSLQRDLRKSDDTFMHDARLDVPSYFEKLRAGRKADADADDSSLLQTAAVSQPTEPGEPAVTEVPTKKQRKHWTDTMEDVNKKVEADLVADDWSFPTAEQMPGVIHEIPVSKAEQQMIDEEPAVEKGIYAEEAREKEEKLRKTADTKALELLVEHKEGGDALLEPEAGGTHHGASKEGHALVEHHGKAVHLPQMRKHHHHKKA